MRVIALLHSCPCDKYAGIGWLGYIVCRCISRVAAEPSFSLEMLWEFAIKHLNQGLAFSRWLDIGPAHDIC